MNYIMDITEKEWQDFGKQNKFGKLVFKQFYRDDEAPNCEDKMRILLSFWDRKSDKSTWIYLSNYGVIDFFVGDQFGKRNELTNDRVTASENPEIMLDINKQIIEMIVKNAGPQYYDEILQQRLKNQKNTNYRINTLNRKIKNYKNVIEYLENRMAEERKNKYADKTTDKLLFEQQYSIKKYSLAINKYKNSLNKLSAYSNYENKLINFLETQTNVQAEK